MSALDCPSNNLISKPKCSCNNLISTSVMEGAYPDRGFWLWADYSGS